MNKELINSVNDTTIGILIPADETDEDAIVKDDHLVKYQPLVMWNLTPIR